MRSDAVNVAQNQLGLRYNYSINKGTRVRGVVQRKENDSKPFLFPIKFKLKKKKKISISNLL